MIVNWDPKATNGRENIADYIREKFGIIRERKFKQNIEQTVETICEYPNIGTIDPLFSDRTEEYRSVIIDGLSKMVYFIKEDTIYIAAFWDCRQEPETEAAETTR